MIIKAYLNISPSLCYLTSVNLTEEPTITDMDLPAIQLLCIEQEQQSQEVHTRKFLQLACLTNFPDHSLCIFLKCILSLNERTKAPVPEPSQLPRKERMPEPTVDGEPASMKMSRVED